MEEQSSGRSLFLALLSIMALVPLIISPAFSQFSLPKLVLLVLGVFVALTVWSVTVLTDSAQRIRQGPLQTPVVVFLVVAFVAAVFSLDPSLSLLGKYRNPEGILTLFLYGALFFMASQIVWSRTRLINLSRLVSATGLLVSLYGIMQFAGVDPIDWGPIPFDASRVFSTFGNPSLLGGYLSSVLIVTLGLSLHVSRSSEKVLWSVGSGIIGTALIYTQTRGAWIAAVVGLIVLAVIFWRLDQQVQPRAARIVAPLGGFAFTLLIVVASMNLISSTAIRDSDASLVTSRVEPVSLISIADRFEMWKTAAHMVADRPAVGQGIDSYRLRYEKFQTLEGARIKGAGAVGEDAHSYPLQIFATGGMITLAALLFLWTSLFKYGTRAVRVESDKEPGARWILGVLLAGVVAYMVSTLFTINVIGGFILFWLVAGIVSSRLSVGSDSSERSSSGRFLAAAGAISIWLTSLLAIVIIALLAVGDVRYMKAQNEWDEGLQAGSLAQLQLSAEGFRRAFQASPWIDRYMADLSQNYLDLALEGSESAFLLAADEANRLGADARPLDPWYLVNQGLIDGRRALTQRTDRAADQFEPVENRLMADAEQNFQSAIKLGPHSAFAHYYYGLLLIDWARWDEAVAQLELAADSDPRLSDVEGALEFASSKDRGNHDR